MTQAGPSKTAADYLIAARQAEAQALQHLLRMVRLVVSISSLIHALQRERGASGLFIASSGERFCQQRRQLIADTEQRQREFHDELNAIDTDPGLLHSGNRLLSRIASAVHHLAALSDMRQQITTMQACSDVANHFYSDLIRHLLNVVFEAADSAPDPEITRALVAMFHFMQGKELAGQERALGCTRLASGELSADMTARIPVLLEGQTRCFEIFTHFADPTSLNVWQTDAANCALDEITPLRRTIALPCRSRADDLSLSERWFEACTRRIDAMKRVEDALEHYIAETSEARLAEAREELTLYRRDVMVLQELEDADDVSLIERFGIEPGSSGFKGSPLSPPLARSMIELMQAQALRLQHMQEELDRSRSALEERKIIDRAKGLLMKHRRLREDEAYALLRKLAMDQSRRLVDVARAVLSMADML